MTFSTDKMHDEKIERNEPLDEVAVGELGDSHHLTRQVLWKTDIRCA